MKNITIVLLSIFCTSIYCQRVDFPLSHAASVNCDVLSNIQPNYFLTGCDNYSVSFDIPTFLDCFSKQNCKYTVKVSVEINGKETSIGSLYNVSAGYWLVDVPKIADLINDCSSNGQESITLIFNVSANGCSGSDGFPQIGSYTFSEQSVTIPIYCPDNIFQEIVPFEPASSLECFPDIISLFCCSDFESERCLEFEAKPSLSDAFAITGSIQTSLGQSIGIEINLGDLFSAGSEILIPSDANWVYSYCLQRPEFGCNSVGIVTEYLKSTVTEYTEDCDGVRTIVSQNFSYRVTDVHPSTNNDDCWSENPYSHCGKPKPRIYNEENFASILSCEGKLNVEDYGFDDPEDFNSSYWISPTGEEVVGNCIEGEVGQYTLIIKDQCCNLHEFTYTNCPNKEAITPWIPNIDYTLWCRTVECFSNPPGQDSILNCGTFEECVEPTFIEEDYNNGKCRSTFYYNDEILGFTSLDPVISENFDNVTKECKVITKCGDTVVGQVITAATTTITHSYKNGIGTCTKQYFCNLENIDYEETAIPYYGFSLYDYGIGKCTQSIICFGEILEEKLETEPGIIETYNTTTGLCDKVARCGGIDYILPSVFPISPPLFWTWSEWQGCSSQVQCSIESGFSQISGSESFFNWDFNSNTNMCQSSVRCEGSEVFGAIHSEFPQSLGIWTFNQFDPFDVQCRRQVYCSGNLITEYSPPTQTVGEICTCPNGNISTSYYIYCKDQQIDFIPCVPCFQNDGESHGMHKNKNDNINIYPNPFIDKIVINGLTNSIDEYSIILYDNTGSKRSEVNAPKSNLINFENLENGVYFLQIWKDDLIITNKKLINIK